MGYRVGHRRCVIGAVRGVGLVGLVVVLSACDVAPDASALHLLRSPPVVANNAPPTTETRANLSGRIVEAQVRDGCPGICTALRVELLEGPRGGSILEMRVAGGVIGDRARATSTPVPVLGQLVSVAVDEDRATLIGLAVAEDEVAR